MMSENTKHYKARLLHLITNIPESDLIKATYESNELPISNKKDKVYKTDIIVKINKNIISIEMNDSYYRGLFIKNATYLNKLESEQFERGDSYLSYSKIIQININNFKKFDGNKLLYKFTMREIDTNEELDNLLEIYHIDLTYLEYMCYTDCRDELEKICFMFKNNIKQIENEIREDDIMDEAYEELERLSQDLGIIGLYDKEKVERKILNTKLEDARITGMELGIAEGIEKGIKQGIKQGIEQGIEQGVAQTQKDVARKLIEKGFSIEDIIEITELTENEIEELK